MGLEIISFNVQNFVDDNEVIENLGIDNISKIKKSAAIARAESEKEVEVAKHRPIKRPMMQGLPQRQKLQSKITSWKSAKQNLKRRRI